MNKRTATVLGSGHTTHPAASWRRTTRGESRWPAVLAVVIASGLQMALPEWLSLGPPDEDKTVAQIRDGVLDPGLRALEDRFGTAGKGPGPAT